MSKTSSDVPRVAEGISLGDVPFQPTIPVITYSAGLTLAPAERQALETLILKDGEGTVRARLRVSRQAFMRALAGLPVRLGTIILIRSGLAASSCASDAHP